LYECLTGQPPFRAETPLDTLVQVIEGEPVPPRRLNPGVPPALETVCLRCLEKAPEARYPSAVALAEDLERYLSGEAVEARRGGPLSWLRRWSRREPALASRTIVLAVCCLVIQANYSISGQVEVGRHLKVMGLFALWGLASLAFQQVLNRKEGLDWIPFAWSAADVTLLTALLVVDNVLDTPLLVTFPTLIAASGLWFRVALVWFTTALCEVSYAFLIVYHLANGDVIKTPHQIVIVAVTVVAVGFVIAYQVQRVRALSRYYERRPLP